MLWGLSVDALPCQIQHMWCQLRLVWDLVGRGPGFWALSCCHRSKPWCRASSHSSPGGACSTQVLGSQVDKSHSAEATAALWLLPMAPSKSLQCQASFQCCSAVGLVQALGCHHGKIPPVEAGGQMSWLCGPDPARGLHV